MRRDFDHSQCLPRLKSQAVWSVRYLYIFIELGLYIIYRHPFFNGSTADRAPFTFFAASANIHIASPKKREKKKQPIS